MFSRSGLGYQISKRMVTVEQRLKGPAWALAHSLAIV